MLTMPSKLSVPKYWQVARAMVRHQVHCTLHAILSRNGDKVARHDFLHHHRGKTIAMLSERPHDVSLGKNADDDAITTHHDEALLYSASRASVRAALLIVAIGPIVTTWSRLWANMLSTVIGACLSCSKL